MMEVPKEAKDNSSVKPISQETLTPGFKSKTSPILEKLMLILRNLKVTDRLRDPKKRLFVIAGACLALVVVLLIIGIIVKTINLPRSEVKPSLAPASTTVPVAGELSIEQKLRNLRDEITGSGFEEKSLVVPEIDFQIEFKLE